MSAVSVSISFSVSVAPPDSIWTSEGSIGGLLVLLALPGPSVPVTRFCGTNSGESDPIKLSGEQSGFSLADKLLVAAALPFVPAAAV